MSLLGRHLLVGGGETKFVERGGASGSKTGLIKRNIGERFAREEGKPEYVREVNVGELFETALRK